MQTRQETICLYDCWARLICGSREILTWSQDQTKSVWSHTHKQVFS